MFADLTRFAAWTNVFHLIDIACCIAVLFPIVNSIRHLREAVATDGKGQNARLNGVEANLTNAAVRSLAKLHLFRQFYLVVISWIYFTRIIASLLASSLPYHSLWLGDFFTELATLSFFCFTGYKFRPTADNPYFSLHDNEPDDPAAIKSKMEEENLV